MGYNLLSQDCSYSIEIHYLIWKQHIYDNVCDKFTMWENVPHNYLAEKVKSLSVEIEKSRAENDW